MVNNKFYLTLFLTLIFSCSVYSQVLIAAVFGDKLNSPDLEFGLEGGYNWSDISELKWFLYTGVLVKGRLGAGELSSDDLSLLGITIQDEEGTYDQKIGYFMVPALIKYRFRNRVYLELGPQFGLRHKAFVEFTAEEGDIEFRTRQNNKDDINRLGAGLTFGTGYRLSDKAAGITLGLKYYYGITNVYKDISGPKNSSLFLKCNIPIGVKKSQELRKQKALEKENDLKKE